MSESLSAREVVADRLIATTSPYALDKADAVLSALGIPPDAPAAEIARSSACIVSTCGQCGGTGDYANRPCRSCNGHGVYAVRREDVKRREERIARLRAAAVEVGDA